MALFQGQGPLTNALQSFLGAKQQAATQRLMGPAMSGDPEAVSQLMGVNPQLGMQVQNQLAAQQAAQAKAQQAMRAQALEELKAARDYEVEQRKLKAEEDKPVVVGDKQRLVTRSGDVLLEANEIADNMEKLETDFDREKQLRGEVQKFGSDFRTTEDAYSRITSLDETAAGDLALIFNYMKMLDPGSVVRESEFSNAEQARAWLTKMDEGGQDVPAFVKQGIQKLTEGTRLLPEQRKDFLNQAQNLYGSQKGNFEKRLKPINQAIKKYGLDQSVIYDVMDLTPEPEEPPATPEVPVGDSVGRFTITVKG